MTLRSRRIIYLSFILIFVIITPLIILYAAGYRYNFQKHKIQKTGILILKSEPTGASIYLNGDPRKETTPARIANLLPDDYTVRIEKENFHPWQKTLPVESGLTTFAENIFLSEKNLPGQVVETNSELFSLSPNKQKIIYLNRADAGSEVWLLDLKNSQKKIVYQVSEKTNDITDFEWSNDSKKILITITFDKPAEDNKYILLNTETDEVTVYQKLSDFYLTFKGIPPNIADISSLSDLSVSASSSGMVALLDKKTRDLSVLNSSGNSVFETKADKVAWSPDGKKLLYLTDFEIWIYNFSTSEQTFVSRYGQEIKQIDWVNENYIVILLSNTVKVIELDERDQRNVVNLLTLEKIDNFFIDGTKRQIYFYSVIGNQKGVFELPY